MKRKLLTLIFILFVNQLFAQQYFSKRYNYEYDNAFAVLPFPNQNKYFLVMPYADTTFFALHFIMEQIDSTGNALWVKNFTEPIPYSWYVGLPGSLEFYDDTTLFMSGTHNNFNNDDALLMKLDLQGNSLWRRTYGNSFFQAGWQAKKTRDGGFVIVVNSNEFNTHDGVVLIRTDASGNELWSRHYGSGQRMDLAVTIDTTIDGGFILAGSSLSASPTGSGCADMFCIKTDSLGNSQWTKFFGGIYYDAAWSVVQCKKDSSIVLAGYISVSDNSPVFFCDAGFKLPYVVKLNLQGDTIWTRTYGDADYYNHLKKIRELPDGSLICAGTVLRNYTTNMSAGLIIKIASNGDSLWYNKYDPVEGIISRSELNDIRLTSDGGFIAAGVIFPRLPDTGDQDGWILKIDSNGCTVFNCLVNSISSEHKDDRISVYPNPSCGKFFISMNKELKYMEWEVFDFLGNSILSGNSFPPEIDLNNEPSGIYFCRIKAFDKNYFSCKLVKN